MKLRNITVLKLASIVASSCQINNLSGVTKKLQGKVLSQKDKYSIENNPYASHQNMDNGHKVQEFMQNEVLPKVKEDISKEQHDKINKEVKNENKKIFFYFLFLIVLMSCSN